MRLGALRGRSARWLGVALLLAALAHSTRGADAEEPGPFGGSVFDQRGWLTCEAYLRMSLPLRSSYLLGLREGWMSASSGLEGHATREDLPEEHRSWLQHGASWMRQIVDGHGAPLREILEGTTRRCEAKPEATAWVSWLDAVRDARAVRPPRR